MKLLEIFRTIVNESSGYKIGDSYLYKNDTMAEPISGKIKHIDILTNRVTVKLSNGRIVVLLPHQYKYLSQDEQPKDEHAIINDITDQIDQILGINPKKLTELIDYIVNGKTSGTIHMRFTDEIKDGRSPSFNIDRPLRLKGKTLTSGAFSIKIIDIKFDNQSNQPSDYNEYVDYNYAVTVRRV